MDNYFKNCPPLMSDGRHFTDYKTATRRNEYIKYVNDIYRDDDYRMLLQCNAARFMDNEWDYYSKKMNCHESQCVHNYPTRVLPQFFRTEMKAYNDSMDPTKPKLKHTCPQFNDYRLTNPQKGMTCGDKDITKTKTFDPSELISTIKKSRGEMEQRLSTKKVPIGIEETPQYAPVVHESLLAPSANLTQNSAPIVGIKSKAEEMRPRIEHEHFKNSENEEDEDSEEYSEDESSESSEE